MNVENVNKLIDHMESIHDSEYCQRTFIHACGTPACVAGHTAYIGGAHFVDGDKCVDEKHVFDSDHAYIGIFASEYLELSEHETCDMFTSFPILNEFETTKQEAINMLRNFLNTGKVIWRKEYDVERTVVF